MMHELSYPIGTFSVPQDTNPAERASWIRDIELAPERLREALVNLNDTQLDTPYRDGGWTVRQVVHHLADAGMNCFVRTKLALTEDAPLIKTFEEQEWVMLPDTLNTPVDLSLSLLGPLHQRWALLLKQMTDKDFEKTYRHPVNGSWTLHTAVAFFAWHTRHHIAHITALRQRMEW